jgi:hypothetical protein
MRNQKFLPSLIFTVAISGGFSIHDVQASPVSPSELFVNDPAQVLMVDGKDRHSNVPIRVRLDTPNRSAFDFGFIRNDGFLPITGKSRKQGDYTFAGGSIVDFALRNKGGDGLSGTADDLIYRLSDGAGYASQHYFAAIDPAKSRHPVVTEPYYHILSLNWDLNLDGLVDAHALLKIRGSKYDGMMPASMTVSLPGASWLLGSGLAVLGVTARRRKRPA